MRRAAGTTLALGAIGAGGSQVAPQYSPVGRAEAVAPAAYAVGGAIAVGWAIDEYDLLDSDSVEDVGYTPEAFYNRIYDVASTRASENSSTFVDNRNIIDGIKEVAYSEAKIAGIEALNDQESQSDVEDAAHAAIDDQFSTVMDNYIDGWNEAVEEWRQFVDDLIESEEYDFEDDDIDWTFGVDGRVSDDPHGESSWQDDRTRTNEYELPDGTTKITQSAGYRVTSSESNRWDCTGEDDESGSYAYIELYDNELEYLHEDKWQGLFFEMEDAHQELLDELSVWVDTVYDDVQSGDLDSEELLSARELAAMAPDDERYPRAMADLQVLGYAVDTNRRVEVYLKDEGLTLYGNLASSGDLSIETGKVIDPDDEDYEDDDLYLTYDTSIASGEWDDYDDDRGIDGGELYFTEEPYEASTARYEIETSYGEVVIVDHSDFEPVGEDEDVIDPDDDESDKTLGDAEYWRVDISNDLEQSIADVESLTAIGPTDESDWQTMRLEEPFEIVEVIDMNASQEDWEDLMDDYDFDFDDIEVDDEDFEIEDEDDFEEAIEEGYSLTLPDTVEIEYERPEPHDDDNYMTEDEWEDRAERTEQLLDDYEDALEQEQGPALPGVPNLDDVDGSAILGFGVISIVVIGVIGLVTDTITDLMPWT